MSAASTEGAARVYRLRDPASAPFYQLVDRYYDQFEREYSRRYEAQQGFWRPIIGDAVGRFLNCGDLKQGFARLRCADCGSEYFIAFSCKQRCACPSCHQKRALITGEKVAREICESVAHRQLVFTIPKRFRLYFRYDRALLTDLSRAAWAAVRKVAQLALDREDVSVGMISGIQTFGELIHWHPHIHALVTEGAWTEDGQFLAFPKIPASAWRQAFEQEVFRLLLRKGRIDASVVESMKCWSHSGFSVDGSVTLGSGDRQGIERLIQYFIRCPFSQARIAGVAEDGSVTYRAEHSDPQRFPMVWRSGEAGELKRNFTVYTALDFLAAVTQHIPDRGRHLLIYYGFYSKKSRGLRAKSEPEESPAEQEADEPDRAPAGSLAKWAALIKKVYEADPLICPYCKGELRVVSFIEARQHLLVKAILEHLGLWDEPERERGPPVGAEVERVGFDEFLFDFLNDPDADPELS